MRKIRRFLKVMLTGLVLFVVCGAFFLGYRNYTALKQVYTYESLITQETEKNNISEYSSLALAIMLTESKGQGDDPMQSSESLYGEQNQFESPEESITQGVAYLAELIDKAKTQGCDLWTAVQAYNFGTDYIDYVAKHGSKNTLELAESYSKEVLSPLLGNDDQQTYRYWGIRSFLYNGGYLYHNGGNLFYADLVKMNQWKVTMSEGLFS